MFCTLWQEVNVRTSSWNERDWKVSVQLRHHLFISLGDDGHLGRGCRGWKDLKYMSLVVLGDGGQHQSLSPCVPTVAWPALVQPLSTAWFILRYCFHVACASLQRPWGVSPIMIFKNSSSKGAAFLEKEALRATCFQLSLGWHDWGL